MIAMEQNVAYDGKLSANGTGICNATASFNETCADSHPFSVNINGGCQASDVDQGCWFIYNCICNGTTNGYQFRGFKDKECKGPVQAIHTLPIDTCQKDYGACDGSNVPFDGYYAYLDTSQFLLCCPMCSNVTKSY